MSENRYLSGNFAPVEEELTVFDLPVTGTIPRELSGRLLRIGPNPVEAHHGEKKRRLSLSLKKRNLF